MVKRDLNFVVISGNEDFCSAATFEHLVPMLCVTTLHIVWVPTAWHSQWIFKSLRRCTVSYWRLAR